MATETPRYLAFRAFGDFHWPFTTTDINKAVEDLPAHERRKGVVEIYYGGDTPTALAAFLRWVPYAGLEGRTLPEPFTGAIAHDAVTDIRTIDNKTLWKRFADLPEHESIVFRLGGPGNDQENFGPRLLFRGAFLFDQFALDPDENAVNDSHPEPDLRWFLARTFRQNGNGYFSEIVIGQTGDNAGSGCRIRFNLALPTPGAQSGDDDDRCYALPFAAIFKPVHSGADGQSVPVERFIAGPGPSKSVHDSSVDVVAGVIVANPRLGRFGFSGGVKSGKLDFLYFPRSPKAGDYRFGAFWPTSEKAFIETFLSKLSSRTPPSAVPGRIKLAEDATDANGELTHSVRFIPRSSKDHRTTMVFRTRIEGRAAGDKPNLTDDLRVRSDGFWTTFQLRVPDKSTNWLLTETDTLYVEREVAYALPDAAIWSPVGEQSAGGHITVRFGFARKFGEDPDPPSDTISLSTLFERARQGMRLARLDLRNVADGQPQSILPEIELAPGDARFMVCGKLPFRFEPPSIAGAIAWIQPYPGRDLWCGFDPYLSLWANKDTITAEKKDKIAPGRISITLRPLSLAHRPDAELELDLISDPGAPSGDPSWWAQFKIVPRQGKQNPSFAAKLGGLEFATRAPASDREAYGIVDDTSDENDYSHWRFGDRPSISTQLPTSNNSFQTASLDLRLRFDIDTIVPISPDIPWGDRSNRPAPLLIPVDGRTGKGEFVLDLREIVGEFRDRQLTASIYDTGKGETEDGVYVILSEEPFTITRFRSQPLQDRGAQDNALVASFDSDTRQWQVKLTSPTYHYEFPPQVAGESMDKPRRLEIVDYPEVPTVPREPRPLPGPPGTAAVQPIDKDGNPRAVEFRLTPSAELWIRPSDVERGYFLPEWASHEIFRQRGDLGIGAAMAGMRGEFLYGLSVGIDPARESGAARSARVAEIEALTGHPPRKLGVSNVSTDLAVRWKALDRVIARRPERIEIWARDLDSAVPFAPAKFSDGVAFALRRTALHRPPLEGLSTRDDPASGRPRTHEKGLSGGALWPLESKNFFNALLERPTSEGGTIEQIALSPIGGDANQKAEFLNRKVRIISETRNGFVQRHKVEIIGRVSVFWHWAKHVVVYERTVNPSAQFTPDGGIGNRTRRPVLRKVSEYIYIRQPQGIRRYPDFPTAKPSSSGLLKAVKFNSITINVDSAWSEDIGKYGWKIPLWNRDAARRRPQVYPRPDIGFSTVAEGQGEEAEATQECLEPDNIYFYADASPDTGPDTDSWPSLIGIDCSRLPPPSHDFQRDLSPDARPEGKSSASAPRIPRGHRRFTWRLAPPSKKTALNAGRSAQPLFAGLESITFMRSNAPEPSDANKQAIAAMANAVAEADKLVPLPSDKKPAYWSKGSSAPIDAFKPVDALLLAVAADHPDQTEVLARANELETALTTDLTDAAGIKDAIDAAAGYASKLSALSPYLTDGPSRCEQMAEDFVGSIRRKELLILDAVGTWEADAEEAIPKDAPLSLEALKRDLVDSLANVIASSLKGVAADVGRLDVGVEKARSILRDFENDVRQAEEAIERQLRTLKAAYDDTKPWSKKRLADFQAKLLEAGDRAFEMVRTAVEEAATRLSTELDNAAQKIGHVLRDAMLAIDDESSALKAAIDDVWRPAETYLDTAIGRLDELLLETNGKDLFDRLDEELKPLQKKLPAKYADKAAIIDKVRQRLPSLRQKVEEVRRTLQDIKNTNPHIELVDLVNTAAREAEGMLSGLAEIVEQTASVLTGYEEEALSSVAAELGTALAEFNRRAANGIAVVRHFGAGIDSIVDAGVANIQEAFQDNVFNRIEVWLQRCDETAARIDRKLTQLEESLGADQIAELIEANVLRPAIDGTLAEITDAFLTDYANARKRLLVLIGETSANVQTKLQGLTDEILGNKKDTIVAACNAVAGGISDTLNYLERMKDEVEGEAARIAGPLVQSVQDVIDDFEKLREVAEGIAGDVRQINNDIATSYASAKGYGDRVLESAGNLGSGGIGAAPGNILRLYAAAASAPALPNLDFARERLGYYYNQLNDVIDTTPVEAWFGRLGDELKAIGLSIPFSKIGDRIIPDDLSNFDISRIFKNFSGMKLDKLFKGYKLPAGAKDAIKVTHAFDKAQARAWVQIDVDLPISQRRALFSVGPFEVDFVDSRFVAIVRLEASKDSDKVDQIGRATLTTNIEAVVSGQPMVTLQRVAMRYEKSTGLKIDFDPKNIKLNDVFKFIQDTLGSLFPDEVGGMKIIKDRGIPVGVEHEFAMPPVSLNFATSGVTNILINNRFALIAYPEFVISDRFSLSKPELPFIFSIFIIGGTGYITVDTEYRPFTNKGLMVVVEAAAGGSAQLAFAFGPVSGTVFITLSIALAYRKVFGQDGGGLTVSLVLVIAGNVDVAGLINIYIGLVLRMSYRDNGAIDATGTLTVTIRIARFFKISVRANVKYQLRGGQSKTTTSVSSDTEITDKRLADAKTKADKLLNARG